MSMGVTSYSGKSPRRRGRPLSRILPHSFSAALAQVEHLAVRVWPLFVGTATMLAVAHLALVAVLPGGRNALFAGSDRAGSNRAGPDYLSLFQVGDALGFYTTSGRDGFIVFKIFTQEGQVVEGVFPDKGVAPRLRYDRWAVAGDAASRAYPELHTRVTEFVLDNLPSPPVRMELYAARWRWDRNSLTFPWPGKGPETVLELRLLGNYRGLTRTWEPAAGGKEGLE